MQLEVASGNGNSWMACGTWRVEASIAVPLRCRVIISVRPCRSLICGTICIYERCLCVPSSEQPQLALRRVGMLSPGTDVKQGDLFSSIAGRGATQLVQIYRREKDASMTRELQFCNPPAAGGAAPDGSRRRQFTALTNEALPKSVAIPGERRPRGVITARRLLWMRSQVSSLLE